MRSLDDSACWIPMVTWSTRTPVLSMSSKALPRLFVLICATASILTLRYSLLSRRQPEDGNRTDSHSTAQPLLQEENLFRATIIRNESKTETKLLDRPPTVLLASLVPRPSHFTHSYSVARSSVRRYHVAAIGGAAVGGGAKGGERVWQIECTFHGQFECQEFVAGMVGMQFWAGQKCN